MKNKLLATLAVLAVASTASLHAQFTVVNPSFENPNNDGNPSFPAPLNWTTFGELSNFGVIDQANSNIPNAADGTQWLFMAAKEDTAPPNPDNGGVFSESIGASSASDTLDISFALGENQAAGAPLPTGMDVFVQGSNDGFTTLTNSFSSVLDPSAIIGAGTTASQSVSIASPGNFADVRIGFRILDSGSNGGDQVLIDNVAVVPEPGAYALLAGCTGLLFVMLRRRGG